MPSQTNLDPKNNFNPDWVSPLGNTIKELLFQRMADCLYISLPRFMRLLSGDAPWTKEELGLVDVIFRDIMFQNKGKDFKEHVSILEFLTRREEHYWEEIKRLYTLTEEDALCASYSSQIHTKVYHLYFGEEKLLGSINNTKKKSYLLLNLPPIPLKNSRSFIVRRLLDQDKIRHGIYWNAGINFKQLFAERPSYIFDLNWKDNFSQPYITNMRPYVGDEVEIPNKVICSE